MVSRNLGFVWNINQDNALLDRTIAHYDIVEQLGRGGMGVVYKALDTKLNRFVALKFLPPREDISRDARLRFLREARAASALDHPNICSIHGIGETEDGEQYIVMGWYDGRTLRAHLEEGPIDPGEAVTIARQLADALHCAHAAKIAHEPRAGSAQRGDRRTTLRRHEPGGRGTPPQLGASAAEDLRGGPASVPAVWSGDATGGGDP